MLRSHDRGSLMRRVILILLAAAAVLAWRGISATDDAPGIGRGIYFFWALIAVFELPLLFLCWRQLARPGPQTMALTAAVTITAFVGLLPITGLLTLFSGFAMEVKQLYWLFYLWAFLGVLLLAGILAFVDYRRIRMAGQPALWVQHAGGAAIYVVLGHAVVGMAGGAVMATQEQQMTDYYRAKEQLQRINRCASQAAALADAKGYPVSLAALGPAGTRCLDAEVAAGKLAGWTVEYLPGLPDATGRILMYATCAQSTVRYREWKGAKLVSHENTDHVEVAAGGPSSSVTCENAWSDQDAVFALRGLAACAMRYAHERPLEGYPSTLDDLRGVRCKHADGKIDYRTDPATDGPRRSFEAVKGGSSRGSHGRFYIDETGVVRYEAKGEPGKQSLAFREFEARRDDSVRRRAEEVSAAGRAALAPCEAGDADACDRHAEYLLLELRQSEAAETYFRRACEAGRPHACAAIARKDAAGNPEYDGIYVRAQCRLGNERACEAVPRIRPGMTRDEVRALEATLF